MVLIKAPHNTYLNIYIKNACVEGWMSRANGEKHNDSGFMRKSIKTPRLEYDLGLYLDAIVEIRLDEQFERDKAFFDGVEKAGVETEEDSEE